MTYACQAYVFTGITLITFFDVFKILFYTYDFSLFFSVQSDETPSSQVYVA